MTISYIKQARNENRLVQGLLKPNAEIDHVLKLTNVERAELDTFIQGNNSNVTPRASLSENQEDKLDWW
jgi:hypothetical protein